MTAGKGSRTSPEKENPECRCEHEIREKKGVEVYRR